MPKPIGQAAAEGLPNLTRRRLLAGAPVAAAAIALPSVAVVSLPVATVAMPKGMTAEQRFEHHLAEFKKAVEELDPRVHAWSEGDTLKNFKAGKDFRGAIVIAAYRYTGKFEGEGIYRTRTSDDATILLNLISETDKRDQDGGWWYFLNPSLDHRSGGNGYYVNQKTLETLIISKVSNGSALS